MVGFVAILFFGFISMLSDNGSVTSQQKNTSTGGQQKLEITKAKISTPPQESELEKTVKYGDLYCDNFESNKLVFDLFQSINASRVMNGQKKLKWSPLLCESAKLKSADLIINNYFEHVSPSGLTPWYFIEKVGYKYTFSGENLALNYYTAGSAHEALMNSQGHKENILNRDFTEIGLGYWSGKIDNQDAFVIVQHFADPAPSVPPVKYVCEVKKAKGDLKDLEKTKKKIDNYLDNAADVKKDIEKAGGNTDEVNDYINDLEDKKKKVKEYIEEIDNYLDECKKL